MYVKVYYFVRYCYYYYYFRGLKALSAVSSDFVTQFSCWKALHKVIVCFSWLLETKVHSIRTSSFFLFIYLFIYLYSGFLLVIHFVHISVYMSIPISQFITPPPPPPLSPPWRPYVCSLHLCLYFCPANWFICTIFLGATYMR